MPWSLLEAVEPGTDPLGRIVARRRLSLTSRCPEARRFGNTDTTAASVALWQSRLDRTGRAG